MDNGYSLANAQRFGWATVTGNLREERQSYFAKYLVGKTVLDVGCSGGGYVEYLSNAGFQVVGLERYEEFLKTAKGKTSRGAYVQGDAEALPFRDKTFDCTYCFDVLEHVDDKLAIQEFARVTKQRLILAVPKEDDLLFEFGLTFGHYVDKTHLRYYTERSLTELISGALGSCRLTIFSDIEAPIKKFVQNVVDGQGKYGFDLEFAPSIVFRSLKYALNDVKNMHVPSVNDCLKRARRTAFLKMLNSVSFGTIHSNLVAIVELS
jgi:SAM-dependent methyltransferase